HLHFRHADHRLAMEHGRQEFPGADGFHGALVETEPESLKDLYVLRLPERVHLDAQYDRALEPRLAGVLGVLGLALPDENRLSHRAAESGRDLQTGSVAVRVPPAVSSVISDAGPFAVADSA